MRLWRCVGVLATLVLSAACGSLGLETSADGWNDPGGANKGNPTWVAGDKTVAAAPGVVLLIPVVIILLPFMLSDWIFGWPHVGPVC